MKLRRGTGSTLGLVAVCALVIVLIGIACFFLAKIFGGGREVSNATDAGTLNVAKRSMYYSAGVLNQNDPYYYCTKYPPGMNFSNPPPANAVCLLNYNRLVGQATLIAMNAHEEGTQAAQVNINNNNIFGELASMGAALTAQMNSQGQADFQSMASMENTKMWGQNQVQMQALALGCTRAEASTNIFFLPQGNAAIPSNVPPGEAMPAASNGSSTIMSIATARPDQSKYPNTTYMAGYHKMTYDGRDFQGLPIMPQTTPHLISLGDFNSATNAPNFHASLSGSGAAVPNSFKITSQCTEAKSGARGGAIAAALVGLVNDSSNKAIDFPAAIPGGYIVIQNGTQDQHTGQGGANGDDNIPTGWVVNADGSHSIFNNELFNPGIDVADNNGVFTTDAGELQQWANYNNSATTITPTATTTTTSTDAAGNVTVSTTVNGQPSGSPTTTAPTTPPASPVTPTSTSTTSYSINVPFPANDVWDNGATKYPPGPQSVANGNPITLYNVTQYPPNVSGSWSSAASNAAGNGDMRIGNVQGQMASTADIYNITGQVTNCNAIQFPGFPAHCQQYMRDFNGNYGDSSSMPATTAPVTDVSALEYMKAEVMEDWYNAQAAGALGNRGYSASITKPDDTGLKVWNGPPYSVHNGGRPINGALGVDGSPYALLNQIMGNEAPINAGVTNGSYSCGGGVQSSAMFKQIAQRCAEIVPGTTTAKVVQILSSMPIALGQDLYVWADPQTQQLQMSTAPPPNYVQPSDLNSPQGVGSPRGQATGSQSLFDSGKWADGPVTGPGTDCNATMDDVAGNRGAYSAMVDTEGNGHNGGDDNLHEAPFIRTARVEDQDDVKWRAGSGAGYNCMGVLQFNNSVSVSGQFSYPN